MSGAMMSALNTQHNINYLKYGVIRYPTDKSLALCLICEKLFSNECMNQPSTFIEHLNKKHPEVKDKNLPYFQELEDQLYKNISTRQDTRIASYKISLLIAKAGMPYAVGGDMILPAVKEVMRTVLHQTETDILNKINLSSKTVQRRIDKMSQSVEESLCEYLKINPFSLLIDECILLGNEILVLVYVRFMRYGKTFEELLFSSKLAIEAGGELIFHVVDEFLNNKEIPLNNIASVAIDGAQAMESHYCGFIAFLKQKVSNVVAVHGIIYKQHLVEENLSDRLNRSLQYVINAINNIKSYGFDDKLLGKLFEKDKNSLLLQTELRWLSIDSCLNKFYTHFDAVVDLFENTDNSLEENLILFKSDIAYLVDLYNKFNDINVLLQATHLNLIETKTIISAFVLRLLSYKCNLLRREFYQFPTLATAKPNDDDILFYCQHLELLYEDINIRFEDVLKMKIPSWILDPFKYDKNLQTNLRLQDELIQLSANEELKYKHKHGFANFWLQKQISVLYPGLWNVVSRLMVPFPSSTLADRGFITVLRLLNSKNLSEIATTGDLRLQLTNVIPRIEDLTLVYKFIE